MNCRTLVPAALVALCLGAFAASARGVDLRYPVSFDDRTGPVYYQNAVLYQPVLTAKVDASRPLDPAPTYAQPAATYSQPAPTYAQPAPTYSQPAPVYSQPVAPTYVAPSYVRQSVTTTYAPIRVKYAPRLTYAPAVTYTPRVAYSPTCVSTYRTPVHQTPTPVVTGPRVYVRPKVYVEGQPIRNLIRAITP